MGRPCPSPAEDKCGPCPGGGSTENRPENTARDPPRLCGHRGCGETSRCRTASSLRALWGQPPEPLGRVGHELKAESSWGGARPPSQPAVVVLGMVTASDKQGEVSGLLHGTGGGEEAWGLADKGPQACCGGTSGSRRGYRALQGRGVCHHQLARMARGREGPGHLVPAYSDMGSGRPAPPLCPTSCPPALIPVLWKAIPGPPEVTPHQPREGEAHQPPASALVSD